MFKKRGLININRVDTDEERLLEIALEAGADDVNTAADAFEVVTAPETFDKVRDTLRAAGVAMAHAELSLVPDTTVHVTGHAAQQTLRLLEALDDHDDVQSVASNADFDQEELEKMSA
jgi:transcriptional/translational regulatory protein YebC/TACO1